MIDNPIPQQTDIINELERNALPTTRITHCTQPPNTWGGYFLDLVKSLNLCILNGRFSETSGLCTTTNSSIVDYFLSNVNMIPYVTNVSVLDFCPLLSDVHMPLDLKLVNTRSQLNYLPSQPLTHNDGSNTQTSYKSNKWDGNKVNDFINNIEINYRK